MRCLTSCRISFGASTWYLRAFCRERNAWRIFKLFRMKRLEILRVSLSDINPDKISCCSSFVISILSSTNCSVVDGEFVEQVCRIYVTHPGVDAQGIVDKMEVSALFERRL